MKVELRLFATLRRYLPRSSEGPLMVEAVDGETVGGLMRRLQIPAEEIKLVFIDGAKASVSDPLSDGARVGVFPPVGGG